MPSDFELTRREFVKTAAQVSAGAIVVGGATLPAQTTGAGAGGLESQPAAKEVAMGSVFPYGAVYFRKTNPPEEAWARDHKTAARVGMNTFRHWVFWGAVEIVPGKFDWAGYDQMMDIAHANGINVILSELVTCAPEWAFRRYASSRYKSSDGSVAGSNNSGLLGGSPGLCLDDPEAKAGAERFLTALIEHYRDHPALLGYDLWNENIYNGGEPRRMNCYCDGTKARLREWLHARYGSLAATGKTWKGLPGEANNEWRSAAMMDVWGMTWVASRKGHAPWQQYQTLDLVRSGARGKPFWHAEAECGPLWMEPQVIGRPREDGCQPDAEDVRIWNLVSCAGGARGILYPRWQPLLDSALFGAFGPFAMDGSETPRSQMAGRVATWANCHPNVWKSRPIKGEVGILFIPESEIFNFVQQGSTDYYAQSTRRADQAFFDSNILCDFVRLDDIDEYKLLYLAYPVMLKKETADKLKAYVQRGGVLICEGVPRYFGDSGHVGTVQPNLGLDELFGAREKFVEFDPDLSEKLMFEVNGNKVHGRYFRQDYDLHGGTAAGQYSNGNIAARLE